MFLTTAFLLAMAQPPLLAAQAPLYGDDFVIRRASIDSGSGASTGGQFALRGSVGQPDAGEHSGGQFRLQGGFWTPASGEYGQIFEDSFES